MAKKIAGFTLIETIIYIAIFGLVVSSLMSFVMVISALRNKQHFLAEISANERVLGELINYYVKTSELVITPANLATSSELIIKRRGSAVVSRIYEVNGQVWLDDNGTTTAMTTSACAVTGLIFSNLAAAGEPTVMKIVGHITNAVAPSNDYTYSDDFDFNVRLPF